MREIPTLASQKGKLNIPEIVEGLKIFLDEVRVKIELLVTSPTMEENLNSLFFLLYEGKLSWPPKRSSFYEKKSSASNEWCMRIQDFTLIQDNCGYYEVIKSIYDDSAVKLYTNRHGKSYYRLDTMYEERKVTIIFYNSCDKNRKKLSFQKLLINNEPVRICWY